MATTAENLALVRGLRSNVCVCGKGKAPGRSFCAVCYYTLPEEMRRALYRKLLHGYGEAYGAAVEKLKEQGRVR